MMKTKPDTPELEPTSRVERPSKGRSVERGGSNNLIRHPTRKQLERSFIVAYNEEAKYELRRKVKIRVGDKIEELLVIQAIIRQLTNAALNGDVRAQCELLTQYRFERLQDGY